MFNKNQKFLVVRLVALLALLVGTIGAVAVEPVHAAVVEVNTNKSGANSKDTTIDLRTFVVDNPVPILNSFSPNEKVAGDDGFTLILDGTNFVPDSKVLWNGAELNTIFINSSRLIASIPASFILNEGAADVSVENPAPGGGTTAPLSFTISPRTNIWMAHSPEGGIVWDLEVDSNNPSILYVGTSAAGIYKSIDGGESWFAINNGMDSPSINSVAVSPANSSIVLASSTYGTYLSIDAGASWEKVIYAGASNSNCIKFDPHSPNTIYVATGNGLFRTNDGGSTWQDIVGDKFGDFPGSYILQVAVDGHNPGTVYVVDSPVDDADRSVWKTTDSGNTWIQVTKDANGLPASIIRSLEIDPSNPNVLYAGTEYKSGSPDVGLYKTEDSGATWTKAISDNKYYFDIAFNQGNPENIYVAIGGGIYITTNGGQNWQLPLSGANIYTVAADPTNPSVIYGGGYDGLFKSMDGSATWSGINTGLYAHLITTLAYSPENTTLFATTWTGGIWNSTDFGAGWNYLGLGEIYLSLLAIDPNNSTHLFAGNSSYLRESIDGGQSWVERSLGHLISAITFAANSDLYYGINDLQIYKSTDGGATWLNKSTGLPICSATCWVSFLKSDPVDSQTIYAGMISSRQDPVAGEVRIGSLFKTIDGGEHWIEIRNGITDDNLQTLAIDPLKRKTLYLGTYNGVFKSIDGGANWIKSGSDLSYLQVNAIAVDPVYDQIVYAGTEGQGVYRSTDGGTTWAGFNSGMSSGYVRSIVYIPSISQKQANHSSELQTVSTGSRLSRLYSIAGGQVNAYFSAQYAPFTDVPGTYWAIDWIDRLYNAGITGGCSTTSLSYCPESPVTRAQMAVFLEKSLHYPNTFSPPNVAPSFTDTVGHWAEDWIEVLRNNGITGGCGTNLYCPEDPVTRAQMAVFLLKSKYGSNYTPPAVGSSTGFTDVPASYWAAAWIKQLAAEGITGGCGTGTYCPESPVTRAQMAVFLVRTFNLP